RLVEHLAGEGDGPIPFIRDELQRYVDRFALPSEAPDDDVVVIQEIDVDPLIPLPGQSRNRRTGIFRPWMGRGYADVVQQDRVGASRNTPQAGAVEGDHTRRVRRGERGIDPSARAVTGAREESGRLVGPVRELDTEIA